MMLLYDYVSSDLIPSVNMQYTYAQLPVNCHNFPRNMSYGQRRNRIQLLCRYRLPRRPVVPCGSSSFTLFLNITDKASHQSEGSVSAKASLTCCFPSAQSLLHGFGTLLMYGLCYVMLD
jgi:hypothetical protein